VPRPCTSDFAHVCFPSSRPRWANSGTIMGEAQDLRQLYADLMERLRTAGGQQNDQGETHKQAGAYFAG
jgi:hypothetical protein